MQKLFAVALIAFGLGVVPMATGACGSGGSSSTGSGSGGGSGSTTGSSTTSGQNCSTSHECTNGVCNCGLDGKGSSCSDDTSCVKQCNVCM
jgi:hypothetical protein